MAGSSIGLELDLRNRTADRGDRQAAGGKSLGAEHINECGRNILALHGPPIEFLFAPDLSIEQDSLIFIGRIDFAPCDGEIDSP